MITLYSKSCAFLWVAYFWCPIIGSANLNTFMTFHYWGLCLTIIGGFLTRGGIYFLLLIPDTYFLYHFIQPRNSVGRCPIYRSHQITYQTQCQFTNYSLTTISCDVSVHMQCNMPLHVLTCHRHNECYMDRTITSPAYDFHISFHSCQYIIQAYINIHIQHVIL